MEYVKGARVSMRYDDLMRLLMPITASEDADMMSFTLNIRAREMPRSHVDTI